MLFPVLRILSIPKFQSLFRKLRITWFVFSVATPDEEVSLLFLFLYFKRKDVNLFMQDASLLELAWAELLEKNNSVTPKELAEVLHFSA